jgi:hypothetical protein
LLNHLGENKIDIIKTLSSLPSSYALNWLGQDTLNAVRTPLGTGDFAIQDYPSREGADPYNPPEPDRNGRVRYATRLGFSLDELKLGRDVCKQLVADLPDDLAKKFFNIRGVQAALGRTLQQTICGTNWQEFSGRATSIAGDLSVSIFFSRRGPDLLRSRPDRSMAWGCELRESYPQG